MTAPPIEAIPTRPPPPVATRRTWLTPRLLVLAAIGLPTLVILVIMLGIIGRLHPQVDFPYFDVDIGWPALFQANTPTGGDMGAHVLLPQILREDLLPSGRILGWSNDWYAGFPAFYFYFPLPALLTVALDLLLPYGVGFKLTTILGLVALPGAIFFFVRTLGFRRAVASIATVTGSMYVFMESFSIYGGNIKSTLAGEFSFSWSLALSLVYLGLVVRDTREGRRFSPAAGIVLALTAMSHIVTTMVVVVASLPLLFRRNGPKTVVGSWALGFAISGFWALPLMVRVLQGMTTDMGWSPVQGLVGGGIAPGTVATPLPNEFIPIFALGVLGAIWTLLRRDDVWVLITMVVVAFVAYWVLQLPDFDLTVLYNGRLLPYWFLGLHILAGLAIGLAVVKVARWLPLRRQNLAVGGALVVLVLLNIMVASIHDVPGWVRWNYTGYEGKVPPKYADAWPEYSNLMQTVDRLPPGRIMWEANGDMNRYGTPMALMLFPYWTDDHPSMEGLLFESSLTTPFHFLNAAEVSEKPSNPVRGISYHSLNFDRALPHLALYDVAYYVSFTEAGRNAAREAGLEELANPEPWTVFAMPDADFIDAAAFQPSVWEGEGSFLDASLEWYDDVDNLDRWLTEEGPEQWVRIGSIEERVNRSRPIQEQVTISNVELEDHRISFTTTGVGVPHMIKVSYFPNWTATKGADGPYRAAPSLMVVVPTEDEVVLEFTRQGAENIGIALSVIGIGLVAWMGIRSRRNSRSGAEL